MTEEAPQNQSGQQNPQPQPRPRQEQPLNPLAEASRPLSDAPALFRALWPWGQKESEED